MSTVRLNEDTARTVANVVVGAAALGAAVLILRTPTLRRLAFGLARTAVTVTIPAWIAREVQTAWADADRTSAASVSASGHPTPGAPAASPPASGRNTQLL